MLENLNDFIKVESLYTFAGLITATLLFTEGVKNLIEVIFSVFNLMPVPDWIPQLIAILFPIFILIYTAAVTGASFIEYVVAVINGFGVALTAMKSFEIVKTKVTII
jgi:hypothetical protein